MPYDLTMRDALVSQDYLYTLVLKQPDGQHKPSVIGSIVDYIYAPEQPQAALNMLANSSIRIVSLTITEGGYNIDHTTGEFKLSEPNVAHDLQKQSAYPRTVFGLITEGLRIRRERGIPPFTVLSCDNIQGNGDVTKRVLVSFATAQDAEFGGWVRTNVRFPNCMVDRITPVTTSSDKESLLEKFSIVDAWPVVAEPFTQWVVEDHFTCGRPSFEMLPQWCRISVVPDVIPYELMKLRLLNATHQQMAYFGYLSGYRYAHEVAQDPDFVQFLLGYMHAEALPTLLPVPGIDLELYMCTLIRRYANPEVKDTLARLCAESSDRIPKWLLPVVREQLAKGGDIRRAAAVVASWARYAEAVDEDGHPIHVVDRLKASLMDAASKNRTHATCFIENQDVFGDLAQDKRFVAAYIHVSFQLLFL
jgi:mannitol 2-dehydrogenase